MNRDGRYVTLPEIADPHYTCYHQQRLEGPAGAHTSTAHLKLNRASTETTISSQLDASSNEVQERDDQEIKDERGDKKDLLSCLSDPRTTKAVNMGTNSDTTRRYLPKLHDKEKRLLNEHEGCTHCRKFYTGHRAKDCPMTANNTWPDAETYAPLTLEMALASKPPANASSSCLPAAAVISSRNESTNDGPTTRGSTNQLKTRKHGESDPNEAPKKRKTCHVNDNELGGVDDVERRAGKAARRAKKAGRKTSSAKNAEVAALETSNRHLPRTEHKLEEDGTSVAPPQRTQSTTARDLPSIPRSTCQRIEDRHQDADDATNSETNNKTDDETDNESDNTDNDNSHVDNNNHVNDTSHVDDTCIDDTCHVDDDGHTANVATPAPSASNLDAATSSIDAAASGVNAAAYNINNVKTAAYDVDTAAYNIDDADATALNMPTAPTAPSASNIDAAAPATTIHHDRITDVHMFSPIQPLMGSSLPCLYPHTCRLLELRQLPCITPGHSLSR
ncbi:hypothetical protein BYT27DRAFT_7257639 [Phlegmacium glaucopus]|nr:hypothetical protein BYT27DRAFT_7257639 [Phlegmacium glaucopus]